MHILSTFGTDPTSHLRALPKEARARVEAKKNLIFKLYFYNFPQIFKMDLLYTIMSITHFKIFLI